MDQDQTISNCDLHISTCSLVCKKAICRHFTNVNRSWSTLKALTKLTYNKMLTTMQMIASDFRFLLSIKQLKDTPGV